MHTWFLEIAFIREVGMRVCLCAYVSVPRLLKTIINQTFQFLCMTLSIDITDGHGLSNEVHHKFMSK